MNSRTTTRIVMTCGGVLLLTTTPLPGQPSVPCSDCGPGAHWVDTCGAGQDRITDQGALVGIDTTLNCQPDTNLVMGSCAILVINRSDPLDDSANFAGLRAVDGHLDVIDTEIVSMCLTGGGVTLVAGAGQGQGAVLAPSLGAIAEQPGDNEVAESFFDVFFEVDLGGGAYAYNQTALRIQIDINCVPPQAEYLHPTGCLELYTSPVPGQGINVANLVSAEHHVHPNEAAACCAQNGTCAMATQSACEGQGGTLHPGADCDTTGACCLDDGLGCVEATEQCCQDLGGQYQGGGSACLGDGNDNRIDDACEGCGAGLCGGGAGGMLLPMMLAMGGMKIGLSRARRRAKSP